MNLWPTQQRNFSWTNHFLYTENPFSPVSQKIWTRNLSDSTGCVSHQINYQTTKRLWRKKMVDPTKSLSEHVNNLSWTNWTELLCHINRRCVQSTKKKKMHPYPRDRTRTVIQLRINFSAATWRETRHIASNGNASRSWRAECVILAVNEVRRAHRIAKHTRARVRYLLDRFSPMHLVAAPRVLKRAQLVRSCARLVFRS